nr:hypothetical protein [Tanacetum cinerariifolium]
MDERVFPTVMDWQTNAPKDGMPAVSTYSIEAVRALDTHRTPIQKQPEMLLCLVEISRRYYLGDEVYGSIQFNSCLKSYEDSSGVPSTIEKSPLDFADEAGVSDQGTVAPEMPPSEDVPATDAAGAGQAEEVVATDPPMATESRKRGRDGTDGNAPPKSLRRDHADPRPTGSFYGGKSLAAIQLGLASTVFVPENAPVGVSDPDPLFFADPPSRHPADIPQSGLQKVYTGQSEVLPMVACLTPGRHAKTLWTMSLLQAIFLSYANGSLLDTPEACQNSAGSS